MYYTMPYHTMPAPCRCRRSANVSCVPWSGSSLSVDIDWDWVKADAAKVKEALSDAETGAKPSKVVEDPKAAEAVKVKPFQFAGLTLEEFMQTRNVRLKQNT